MALEFRKAVRKSVPMLISVSSVSGGGKTYTSLLMAAGIAGPAGRVGFIDTENGRGEMYADSPGIMKALPNGYDYIRFDPPFGPERYVEYLKAAEDAGITVCVVDSGTHEWEGIGGCTEIAEKNKLGGMPNWSKAKMAHKRFVNHLLTSPMHIIFCLRARDKVKIFKRGDLMILTAGQTSEEAAIAEKDTIVSLGLQPITEKNFVFEMLVSLQLDERTHFASPIKVPEPLAHLFPGRKLITKQDGERIRQWNDTGSTLEDGEQLRKRARAAADEGTESYRVFFTALSPADKKLITDHAANKKFAEQADREQQATQGDDWTASTETPTPEPPRPPAPAKPPSGLYDYADWDRAQVSSDYGKEWIMVEGKVHQFVDGNYVEWKAQAAGGAK